MRKHLVSAMMLVNTPLALARDRCGHRLLHAWLSELIILLADLMSWVSGRHTCEVCDSDEWIYLEDGLLTCTTCWLDLWEPDPWIDEWTGYSNTT